MKHIMYFVLTIITLLRVESKRKHYGRIHKKIFINGINGKFHKKRHYVAFISTKKSNIKRKGVFNNENIQKREKKFLLLGRDRRNPYLSYEYLNKIIENKKYEVKKLLEEHSDENSPLQVRLKYLQHTMNNKLSESIKRRNEDEKHRLSVVADLKRKTFYSEQTVNAKEEMEQNRNSNMFFYNPVHENSLLHLKNPGNAYMMLHKIGFDAVIVNTDSLSTDGHIQDLEDIVKMSRTVNRTLRPAIIVNDIIIHPIQIALAVENRADAVLLNFTILKEDVEEMLHYCINMGIEAIVEVHDFNEIYYATKYGSCILMINEYDLLNNTYELNHAVKAINYTIPEIITIAKININNKNTISYVEQLGSLCYDSICLENKLKDNDLSEFVSLCKKWEAPNKTLLHLNRNNYLKECLNYGDSANVEKHKKTIETLQNMYADKNIKNDYSHKLLKEYEKEFLLENEGNNSNETKEKNELLEKNKKLKEHMLTDEENKIVNNFKKEKQKELLFLNQLRELVKEVDDHCRQNANNEMTDNAVKENMKKEKRLESLLENFTNIDKSFLKNFFSDEEIANIENSIKQVIEQKEKISKINSHKEMKNISENKDLLENKHMGNIVDEYFNYEKEDADNNNVTKKSLDENDISDGPSRGIRSE